MKTKSVVVLLFFAIIFIWSCTDHSINPVQPALVDGRVVGSVHGVILDFCTAAHFDSGAVEISWIVNGELHKTTSLDLGYYSITDLPPGDYLITFKGPGTHALGRMEARIPTLGEIEQNQAATSKDYEHSVTAHISLFGRNAGLQGVVYKKDDSHNYSHAAGVTVTVDYPFMNYEDSHDYMVFPSKYTTVTDDDGFFSFDSLPGAPRAILRTLPYTSGGIHYGPTEDICFAPEQNATVNIGQVILGIDTPQPFLTSNNFVNNHDFPVEETIRMTFSKDMKTETFAYELQAYLPLENNEHDYSWQTIECDTSWTGSTLLEIEPCKVLPAGTSLELTLQGTSRDDHAFNMAAESFTTQKGIEFVSANIERAQGIFDEFPLASNIEIHFSMAVTEAQMNLRDLSDPSNSELYIHGAVSIGGAGNRTVIFNPTGSLEPDTEYEIYYEVSSSIPGNMISGRMRFKTVSTLEAPARVSSLSLLTSPIDYNTTDLQFRWPIVENAEGYAIFAWDNRNNTDRVHVASFTAEDHVSTMTGDVTLPEQFDYYQDDPVQTPFLFGTELTFSIIAYNNAGHSTGRERGPIRDNASPTADLEPSIPGYSADRTGLTAQIFNFTLENVNEYLSEVSASIVESASPAAIVSAALTNHNWSATIRVSVPADSNATGDTLRVIFTDTSGNNRTINHVLQ